MTFCENFRVCLTLSFSSVSARLTNHIRLFWKLQTPLMRKYFSSEKRLFIVFSFRKFVRTQFANFVPLLFSSSGSHDWIIFLQRWSSTSYFTTRRTLVHKMSSSINTFRADTHTFHRAQLSIFWFHFRYISSLGIYEQGRGKCDWRKIGHHIWKNT